MSQEFGIEELQLREIAEGLIRFMVRGWTQIKRHYDWNSIGIDDHYQEKGATNITKGDGDNNAITE